MKKIFINGEIWSDTVLEFKRELQSARGDIEVSVSSPGGGVFQTLTMVGLLRSYKESNPSARLMARIVGLAASAASFFVTHPLFDHVSATSDSILMLHNAWGGVQGDYREHAKMAELLDRISTQLAQAYAQRTRKPISEIRAMMDKETWLFGQELKDAGFVDEIVKSAEAPTDKVTAISRARAMFTGMQPKIRQEAAAALENKQLVEYFEKLKTPAPPNDGVIRDEASLQAAVARARGTLGMPAAAPVPEVPEIVKTEADFQSLIARDRARLGIGGPS